MSLPKAEQKVIPVPGKDDLRKLLAACSGEDFDSVRDTAIIRLFIDCGLRLSELTGLTREDVDRLHAQVTVRGKGSKWRQVDYTVRTGKALTKYLRIRQKHELANLGRPLAGLQGNSPDPERGDPDDPPPLPPGGDRAASPHQFRHWSASEHFTDGFPDQDAMRRFGWSTLEMPRRYWSATGAKRALDLGLLSLSGRTLRGCRRPFVS